MREPDALGEPRRGAARLAIEAGAPLVPAAITGTDHLWLGPIPKPKKVAVAFGAPIGVEELEATPEAAAALLEGELWPEVETQFRGLLSRPGAIAAGLAALGLGGAAAVARQRRRGGRRKGGGCGWGGGRARRRLLRRARRRGGGRAGRGERGGR